MFNPFLKKVNWSKEQQEVIDSKNSIIVKGSAGTGKTLLVLYLSIKFASEGKSVAVIVFTKSLRTYISDFLEKNNSKSNIKVFYESEWFRTASAEFDIILIDEFQDFSFEDIELIINKSTNRVYLFGDDEQKLYHQSLVSKKATTNFIELRHKTKYDGVKLSTNYRVPRQIVGLINSIYRNEDENNPLGFSISELIIKSYSKKSINSFVHESPRVELKHFDNHINQLDWLVQFLNSNSSYKNIGILFKQNESKYNGYFYDKKLKTEKLPGIVDTYNYIKEKGLIVGYKYQNQDNLNFLQEININLMTVHSSKGLEFDCVILPFYSWTNRNHNFNIPYVAFSRCREKLIILYSGIISEDMHLTRESIVDGTLRKPAKNDIIDPKYQSYPERFVKELSDIQKEIQNMDEFYGVL